MSWSTNQEKRGLLLLVAVLVNTTIVIMGSSDVFDGGPTWMWLVVIAVYLLLVFPAFALVLVGLVRERRARRARRQ